MDDEDIGTNNLCEDTYHELRETYRQMTDDVQKKYDAAGTGGVDIEHVRDSILKANDAFTQVKRPREAVLDGKHMKLLTQMTKLNIESSQASLVKFNPTEFAEKLKAMMIPNGRQADLRKKEPWIKVGRLFERCHQRRIIGIEPMVPALETNPAPTVQRRATKAQDSQSTVAKKLTQSETITNEEVQTEEVNRVFKILRRRFKENRNRPLCYYSFIANPNSFQYTIENIFHVAFLLRDDYAEISLDENKLPVIAPLAGGSSNDGESSRQCIISLNLAEWKEMIETFQITEPMIPPPVRENKRPLNS